MRIQLLAVGTRMPAWVNEGYAEYAQRLPPECALQLKEIAPERRGRHPDIARLRAREGERLVAAIPKGARVLALDVGGRSLSTEQLAGRLESWMADGRDLALLVGGPDGLDPQCLGHAEFRWSLSPMTFPHPLVRVILAEQIYRAWTILAGHPYHRG